MENCEYLHLSILDEIVHDEVRKVVTGLDSYNKLKRICLSWNDITGYNRVEYNWDKIYKECRRIN